MKQCFWRKAFNQDVIMSSLAKSCQPTWLFSCLGCAFKFKATLLIAVRALRKFRLKLWYTSTTLRLEAAGKTFDQVLVTSARAFDQLMIRLLLLLTYVGNLVGAPKFLIVILLIHLIPGLSITFQH